MSTCLQPYTSGTSLKIGLSSNFPSYLFCFMITSEIFPIFIAIFFLVILVLFKYNRTSTKYLTIYASFVKSTSVKMSYGKETGAQCFRIKIVIFTCNQCLCNRTANHLLFCPKNSYLFNYFPIVKTFATSMYHNG